MKDCCDEMFILTLEEVLLFIKQHKPDINQLTAFLEHSICYLRRLRDKKKPL
jgi:hypothetical protein